MARDRFWTRLVRSAAVVGLLGYGCSAATVTAGPSVATSTTAVPTPSAPTVAPSPTGAGSPSGGSRLIVLGDGVSGGFGLWSFDQSSRWTTLGPAPAATGLARSGNDLAVLGTRSVELRSAGTPAAAGRPMPLNWNGAGSAKIAWLSRSPNGSLAMVTTDGDSEGYWRLDPNGAITALEPAPNQPFAPLVEWLDDTKLLVLSTDRFQISRLAVLDLSTKSLQPCGNLVGVRFFGVSPDHKQIAAVTDSTVYAGPVEAFIGGSALSTVTKLDSSTASIVWALAFDDSGTRLAMLAATVGPGGEPANVRELVYTNSSSWTKAFDSPTPFEQALDQVWLP